MVCRVLAVGVAILLVWSPVAHRLAVHRWSSDYVLRLHILQVALLFSNTLSCSIVLLSHLKMLALELRGGHTF